MEFRNGRDNWTQGFERFEGPAGKSIEVLVQRTKRLVFRRHPAVVSICLDQLENCRIAAEVLKRSDLNPESFPGLIALRAAGYFVGLNDCQVVVRRRRNITPKKI